MKPQQDPHPSTTDALLAFPASVAQQTFWYLDLMQADVSAFNVPLRFRLTGPLDTDLLEKSLNTVIARHEALRTRFMEKDGELLQVVSPEIRIRIPVIDISHISAERINEEADRLGSIEARRSFQLSKGPMIRAELVRLSAESHMFHVTIHHALFDGMSMTILTRELAVIYQAYFDNKPCPLEPLELQYADFSVWQNGFLESPEMKRQLAYWKQRLAGMSELDMPTDFPRPAVKSWKGDITSILLPAELARTLHAIAARNGATLFHLQLAAYMVLLRRYTGSHDIAVGTPVTGRARGELEPIIGVFINSLILRCDLSGNPPFETLLAQVRTTALEALENQELPFECLVRELRPKRDPGRNPLFQINFNHHRSFAKAGTFGGVTLTPVPSRSPGTIFDLHFFMVERKEGWRASCDYSTDLYTRETADRMLGDFKRLLEDIAENPGKAIDQLEILTQPVGTAVRPDFLRDNPVSNEPSIPPSESPTGGVEQHLMAIWKELLGVAEIGRDDDFFTLGGHSLMALRMFSRINREFGKSLPLATLLQQPTIAKLAALLEPEAPAEASLTQEPAPAAHTPPAQTKSNIVTLAKGGKQTPLFCIHGGDGGVIFYRGLAEHIRPGQTLHAIESLELGNSGEIGKSSIGETATAYLNNLLAIQPEGPYRLARYSFGGVVAHEMACQLVERGHKVDFLALFDTQNPEAPIRKYCLPERLRVFWRQSRGLSFFKRLGLLRSRIAEGLHTNVRIRAELKSARSSGPAEAYSDLRRIQVREENWRAMQCYSPRAFNGRITLFRTSFVNDKFEYPADYGWSNVALSGLDIISVPGHHLALFSPENIASLAGALNLALRRADTQLP